MAYVFLLVAIVFEIAGTFCLKLSDGFTNPWPSALAFVFYGLMNVPLILALKSLDLGLVYATWAGIGIVAAVAIGTFYFSEILTAPKIFFMVLTLVGVIGLNLSLGGKPDGNSL